MSHHCSPKQASKSKLPDPAEHKTKTWVPCTADKKEMPATGWQICSDGIKTGGVFVCVCVCMCSWALCSASRLNIKHCFYLKV